MILMWHWWLLCSQNESSEEVKRRVSSAIAQIKRLVYRLHKEPARGRTWGRFSCPVWGQKQGEGCVIMAKGIYH